MRLAIEGSAAVARAVALCRPQVIAAYPITPQTHIVENLAQLIADGNLHCEMISRRKRVFGRFRRSWRGSVRLACLYR